MWVLECDGDALDGKRKWLRPGKTYVVGRKQGAGVAFGVGHKSVSARHLQLTVEAILGSNAGKLLQASKIKLEDLHSKVGTVLDDVKMKGETKLSSGERHVFTIGSYGHSFWLKWEPIVLAVSFSPKELASGVNLLKDVHSQVGPLGVKAATEFIVGKTTHVVSGARNTTLALEALVNAKPIVTMDFVMSLAEMCRPRSSVNPAGTARLEEDYDSFLPQETDYLPSVSRDREANPDLFRPNPSRASIFLGILFVFLEIKLYNRMLGVITGGEGKSECFSVRTGETHPDALVRHVMGLRGIRGNGRTLEGNSKRVIVVRSNPKGGDDLIWTNWFLKTAQAELQQRFILPGDFLEVILSGTADSFQTGTAQTAPQTQQDETLGIERESAQRTAGFVERAELRILIEQSDNSIHLSDSSSHPKQPAASLLPDAEEPVIEGPTTGEATAQPAASTRPRKARRIIAKQFRGFDDGYDPSAHTTSNPAHSDAGVNAPSPGSDQSLFVTDKASSRSERTQSNKKRKQPVGHIDGLLALQDDLTDTRSARSSAIDDLLPATREMKRRKLFQDASGPTERSPSLPGDHNPAQQSSTKDIERPGGRVTINAEDQDIRERVLRVVGRRRAEIDNQLDKERENLELELESTHLHQPVEIVHFKVGLGRNRNAIAGSEEGSHRETVNFNIGRSSLYGSSGTRWDPAWNGRRNFKRFRPQKKDPMPEGHPAPPKHFISLVLTERNNYGSESLIGSDRSGDRRTHGSRAGASRTIHANRAEQSNVDGPSAEIEGNLTTACERAEDVLSPTDAGGFEERVGVKNISANAYSGPPRVHKRTAPSIASKKPVKRQKILRGRGKGLVLGESSDNSDDELRFELIRRNG